MADKFYVIDSDGNETLVDYEDLEGEMLEEALKPIGGFIFSGEAFLRLNVPVQPFYIEGLLPKHGKMMIYGGAKAGKSTIAIQMGRSIAQGEPLLGLKTNQGRVLYLQHELGVETLQDRLRKTGQTYEGMYFGTTFSMKIDKPEGQEMLARALDAVRPNVLIIDPVYKVISGDENEAQDMMQVVNFLDAMIETHEDTGMAILLLHHSGKDMSRGARGSSIFEGWVDSYLELKRTSNLNMPLKSKLTPKLLRHSAPIDEIDLVLADNMEFQVGDAPMKIVDKLLKFAEGRETFKFQEAIDAGVGSRKSLYDARNILLKEGRLVDLGSSTYRRKI